MPSGPSALPTGMRSITHRTGNSTKSLILSRQIKLRKEKRLSCTMSTFGRRHSNSCLEASRCCLHCGQYLTGDRRGSGPASFPTMLPHYLSAALFSPGLLRCQHLRPCEEVEALVQGEVASTSSLTSRAWVLSIFQVLGIYQHKLL